MVQIVPSDEELPKPIVKPKAEKKEDSSKDVSIAKETQANKSKTNPKPAVEKAAPAEKVVQ
jgi:hypothetical protein